MRKILLHAHLHDIHAFFTHCKRTKTKKKEKKQKRKEKRKFNAMRIDESKIYTPVQWWIYYTASSFFFSYLFISNDVLYSCSFEMLKALKFILLFFYYIVYLNFVVLNCLSTVLLNYLSLIPNWLDQIFGW